MKKLTALSIAVLMSGFLLAQNQTNVKDLKPTEEYDNLHIQKLDTDKNKSSYVIWVKKAVKAHRHEHHTETLYVLEGSGQMNIGPDSYDIKEGDYLNIPENTVHSVAVSSDVPLKVISVQAPEFLGKDRIFEEE